VLAEQRLSSCGASIWNVLYALGLTVSILLTTKEWREADSQVHLCLELQSCCLIDRERVKRWKL
jgi:hypothetical protein